MLPPGGWSGTLRRRILILRPLDTPPLHGRAIADASRIGCGLRARRGRLSWADDGVVGHVQFGLARGIQTFDAAFRLVHDQYVRYGYMAPSQSGRRLSLYDALPTTKVFVASAGGRVVGTVTLIQDSLVGLPMDEIYSTELAGFRAGDRRLAEVSALAMDPAYRTSGVAILMRLMRMMVIYAAEIARLDELCIVVNPRHVAFYRKFLEFQTFGGFTSFGKVNGAPAAALRLDLGFVRDVIDRVQRDPGEENDLYEFLFGSETYRRVMDRLIRHLCEPTLTAEWFAYFFPDDDTLGARRVGWQEERSSAFQ